MASRYCALAIAPFLALVLLGVSTSRGADISKADRVSTQGASAKMNIIEIIPGRSIGAVALGASVESLLGPCGAIPGLKGGMAFKCDSGLTLGCDFHGKGTSFRFSYCPVGAARDSWTGRLRSDLIIPNLASSDSDLGFAISR